MAFDKKPSMYSDRGIIGSSEELDAYGVWVKSEPQDMAANFAEAMGFSDGTVPFQPDFNQPNFNMDLDAETDYEDIDIPSFEIEDPDFSMKSFGTSEFDEDSTYEPEDGHTILQDTQEEASTQLLAKIADELSSIRSELNTLKIGLAEMQSKTGISPAPETQHSGFFSEDDDEKITLTGDEIENIFSSVDISDEDNNVFASQRDADEAALKRLSEQNEHAMAEGIENIHVNDIPNDLPNDLADEEINFGNAGIGLADEAAVMEDEETNLGITEEIFETGNEINFDNDFDAFKAEVLENNDLSMIDTLDEVDEIRNLRLEGATPLSPAPEDSSYLEEDPFNLSEPDGIEEISLNENDLEIDFNNNALDLNISDLAFETPSPMEENEFSGDDPFDSATLDLSNAVIDEPDLSAEIVEPQLEEPSFLDEPSLDEPSFLEEPSLDEPSFLDESSLDEPSFSKEPSFLKEPSLEEPSREEPSLEDITLDEFYDDLSLDMDNFDAGPSTEVIPSIEQVIPEAYESGSAEASSSFDDDLESFTEDFSLSDVDIPETTENSIAENSNAETLKEETSAASDETGGIEETETEGNKMYLSSDLSKELKNVLSYMDHLLESLPEEKIEEFARSEYFDSYKKLFKELGLV